MFNKKRSEIRNSLFLNKKAHGNKNSLFSSKKAQGMSTNTIILLILGIVILVVLILGFMIGWDKLAPWIPKNNVDTIVTACSAACSTGSAYDFCLAKKDLKAEDVKLKDVTCNYLAEKQTKYGISACPSVSCDNVLIVEALSANELPGYCTGSEETVQALIDNTLTSYECE